MDRHSARLVILALLLAMFGCYQTDLPKTLWIEDSWNDEETTQIHRAIDEWNRFSREYCGEDIIIYGGRLIDPNGFQSEIDPGDEYNIIYKTAEPDESYEFLVDVTDQPNIGGYATKTDILIFTFHDYISAHLYIVALHELGHWVGLIHIGNDPNVIMYPAAEAGKFSGLTKKDKQAFCLVHGCCAKEP
ncbi:MAG: matrixin family metalloprotease [Patescibacteria group bacterium]